MELQDGECLGQTVTGTVCQTHSWHRCYARAIQSARGTVLHLTALPSARIRTSAVLFALLAIPCTWIRVEMTGRLTWMSDAECAAAFGVLPRIISGVAVSDGIGIHELTTRVLSILDKETPNHPLIPDDFQLNEHRDAHGRIVMYGFKKWRRLHLDIRRLRCVLDSDDPVAQTRNKRVHEAIKAAAMWELPPSMCVQPRPRWPGPTQLTRPA